MTGTNRKRHLTSLATVVVLAISGSVLSGCGTEKPSTGTASHEIHAMASHSSDSTQTALYAGMRTLWAQHMEWTYATVIAFAGDSPALDASIKRLLRNQTDIGNAIAPFYGNRAGKRLSALLTVHIEEAVPVLSAAKAGDSDALNTAVADWYANARDIADFLASANPHWKRTEMRHMMRAHIAQTIGYASDILGGKHSRAVKKYDAAEAHMADMADMLSQGLVQQFPGKF